MIKNPYPQIKQHFTPIYISGESYSFYINFDNPISDAGFAGFKLDIYNGSTLIAANIGVLQKDIVKDTFYNIYCNFVFPVIPNGSYQFVITSGATEKCRSNCILAQNDAQDVSVVVKYRSKDDFFGYGYSRLDTYQNIFRLPFFKVDYQYETQIDQYVNDNNDKRRNLDTNSFKFIKVETYFLDEDAHDAARAMFKHGSIDIGDEFYIAKTPYQVETNVGASLVKGTVEVYKAKDGFFFGSLNEYLPIPTPEPGPVDYWTKTESDARYYFANNPAGYISQSTADGRYAASDHNHDSSYLKRSTDTLTGNLTVTEFLTTPYLNISGNLLAPLDETIGLIGRKVPDTVDDEYYYDVSADAVVLWLADAGFGIPTPEDIEDWNEAYDNMHIHANKAFLDGIVEDATVDISITGGAGWANYVAGYTGSNIYFKWSGTRLQVKVDATEFAVVPMDISGNAQTATQWGNRAANFDASIVDIGQMAVKGSDETWKAADKTTVQGWLGLSSLVTSVSSANADIGVSMSAPTPVLTLNSGIGSNQIVKRNASGGIPLFSTTEYIQGSSGQVSYRTTGTHYFYVNSSIIAYVNNTGLSVAVGDLKLGTGNNVYVQSLSTVLSPPATSGTTKMLVVDSLGLFSSLPIPSASGTVTSVAIGVPTGLTITSGSPITTAGTITIGLQSGYSIPTTSDQSSWSAKQAALSGTGFVKISGTTISYDNSTYLTTAAAATTYLPLTGGALTGALTGTNITLSGYIIAPTGGTSDIRYKDVVKNPLDLTWLDDNKAFAFKWKKDLGFDEKLHFSYAAQEIQKWCDDLIFSENPDQLAVNHTELHTLEIMRIKERLSYIENFLVL